MKQMERGPTAFLEKRLKILATFRYADKLGRKEYTQAESSELGSKITR